MPDPRLSARLFPALFRPQQPFRESGTNTPAAARGRDPAPASVLEALRSFVGPVTPAPAPRVQAIQAPELVEARLRALAQAGAVVSAGPARGALRPNIQDGPYALTAALSPAPALPYTLEIQGLNARHQVRVERHITLPDGACAIPLPSEINVLHRRCVRRAEAPPGHLVRLRHPAFPQLEITRALRDVSLDGLSFEHRAQSDHLLPGLRVPDVVVTTPSGTSICFDAEVRRVEPGDAGPTIGLRIVARSAADAANWRALVGAALCPKTQLGGVWTEDTWALYAASGYFALSGKNAAWFATQKTAFAAATRKLDAAPDLGCQVVWPAEEGIDATLSVVRVYAQTWFGYQMAKVTGPARDGTSGRTVLREIHLRAYEHAAADPNLQWAMGLVQDSAQWSKLVHHELPRRHLADGGASLTRFWALELDSSKSARPVRSEVSAATAEEREMLLDGLTRTRPWSYREALDLVPERFDLAATRASWAAANLCRERELLVARVGGRPLAAAIVERAEPGIHLYNLLDVVRLYALAPNGDATFADLLEHAGAWYRARGRDAYTCLLEEGTPACAAHLRPRDLGRGTLTLLARDLLPSFFEHVSEVTAPRSIGD